MTTPDFSTLNRELREYYASLDAETQSRFVTTLQLTFGVKDRRNALLWVTSSGTQRNFLNRQTGALELEMREAFLKGLVNDVPPVGVQKTSEFPIDPFRAARKLRQYLSEDYTRESVTSIGFLADKIIYTYDAYNVTFDDIDDDASDEWTDIPTEPEPEPENPSSP